MSFPTKITRTHDNCELELVAEIAGNGKIKPKEAVATYKYTKVSKRNLDAGNSLLNAKVEYTLSYLNSMKAFGNFKF